MHTYLLIVNECAGSAWPTRRRLPPSVPSKTCAPPSCEAHLPGGQEAAQRALALLELIRASAHTS